MHIADTLSRAYPEKHTSREEDSFKHISANEYIPIKSERLTKLTEATRRDSILPTVIQLVQEGWPEKKNITAEMRLL